MHKRGRTWLLALVALVAVGLGAWSQGTATQTHAADDPQTAFDTFIDAVNANDGAAMAASFTDDGYFEDIDPNGTFGLFGMAAMQFAFTDVTTHVVVTDSSVSGNTISGSAEISDDVSEAAGVDRYIQTFVATATGDKLASFVLHYDTSDAQTATYLEYEANSPDDGDDDEPPADAIDLTMAGNQAGQAGTESFDEGVIFAFIGVDPGPDGVEQPAAIRSGTCDNLGDVTQWLAPLLNGNTGALLSMSLDDLTSSPHALTVSDSADNSGVIVSCANIEEGGAPAPTPTGGGTQLPNTGSGPNSDAGFGWPLAALVALGAAALAGSGALRLSLRRR